MKNSGWWKGVLKYALGFGLLGYVIWQFWEGKQPDPSKPPLPGLKDLLQREPDFVALALAAVGVGMTIALTIYRWYLLVRALDLPFTFRNAVRLGLVGIFYNTFLPGAIGGDAVKAYFLIKGQTTRKAAAFATVVADRMFGLFGLILYAAVAGGAFWAAGNPQIGENTHLQYMIKTCGAIVTAAVVGWALLGVIPQRRADRFAERLFSVPKVGHTLAELWFTVWQYRRRPGTVAACLGLSVISHTCMILIFHFAVRVFPPPDAGELGTLSEHTTIAPIGYIMQALFPAPGGVGGGEAIFGYLYTLLEKPLSVGVAGRLTIRIIEWSFGLVGYIAYLRMRAELPVTEAEESVAKDDFGDPHVGADGKTGA
ncbi:MAG: lysylphosphatidylglycerol synthase transmembrane domain-containing protein [Fimbriiglobus sp.]